MDIERLVLKCRDQRRDFYIRESSSDISVVGQVFIDADYDITRLARFAEIQELLVCGRASGKRPLIIDAGANIGAASVYFSMLCPDALIVSIEPEARNFQLLKENTRGLPVLPLPCALSSTPQPVTIEDPGEGEWGYRTRSLDDGEDHRVAVSAVTVREILEAHEERCFPFIVKIDIEGGEQALFAADTGWIDDVPLLIIELHDWLLPKQRSAQPFLRCLATADRDFIHSGENIFTMPIAMPQPQSKLGDHVRIKTTPGNQEACVDTYEYIRRLAAERAQLDVLQIAGDEFQHRIEVLRANEVDERVALMSQVDEAKRAADAALRQVEAAERRAEAAERELASIHASISWRITAPLRGLRAKLAAPVSAS